MFTDAGDVTDIKIAEFDSVVDLTLKVYYNLYMILHYCTSVDSIVHPG